MLTALNLILFGGTGLFFLLLAVSSRIENEKRATWISLGFLAAVGLFWQVILPQLGSGLNWALVCGTALFGALSLARFFPKAPPARDLSEAVQYDERDNMFARNNLKNHPDLAQTYYAMRPENRSVDQQIHNKPDFGDPGQLFHDPYTTPIFEAAFQYLDQTIPLSDDAPAPDKKTIDPGKLQQAITHMVEFYGGCDTGFIRLVPHHYYTRRGRHAQTWGHETDQTYATAIVIVVPMRVEMLKKAPTSAVIQESARKYVEAAKISNILAAFLRSFGYRARAHNDANYEVLCVPAAVEANLGELGRMGIFMHRVHGPCVRLAVVTTDLVLPDTPARPPLFMSQFCRICKKCADNCPSGSITRGDEQESRNFRHWSILQEKCFSYWKTVGSDCGLCIGVCPYTKPDSPVHRLVRFYISRNILNQHIALFMDDLLYGRRKEIPKANPDNILL